jgi:hypothetical protein
MVNVSIWGLVGMLEHIFKYPKKEYFQGDKMLFDSSEDGYSAQIKLTRFMLA